MRKRVEPQATIDGQKAVAQQHQSGDGPQLEVALRKTDGEARTDEAHQVIGADIASEDRGRHAEPAYFSPGQKVIFRVFLTPTRVKSHGHDHGQRNDKHDEIECSKNFTHSSHA